MFGHENRISIDLASTTRQYDDIGILMKMAPVSLRARAFRGTGQRNARARSVTF
jgi:hypothetical protein